MAADPRFQDFGRDVLRRAVGEIGLHVHAWDSPPVDGNGHGDQLYMYELSDELLCAKVDYLTRMLADVFEAQPLSHRAGRWGFDERVARVLVNAGYLVDCSVTPGVSWKKYPGAAHGRGGPDYTGFPDRPYFLDPQDIASSGASPLLEVPMTIRPNHSAMIKRLHRVVEDNFAGRVLRRTMGPPNLWLRPNGVNIETLLGIVDWATQRQLPVIEFMLHSSELMPAGSPTFRTAADIDVLYAHLERLFGHIASLSIPGVTLAEYRAGFS